MNDKISLREPNSKEFLEKSEFSFNNFVNEMSLSTGSDPIVLRNEIGEYPTQTNPNDIWYLIEDNQSQIGFLWIHLKPAEKTAFGYDIYLEPQFRHKGIGRTVMLKCGNMLRELGIEIIEICVFEHNHIARSLYNSLGFTQKSFNEKRKQYTLALALNKI